MLLPLLFLMPWLGVLGFLLFAVRLPRALPPAGSVPLRAGSGDPSSGDPAVMLPSVSIVVPARNEALNIEACVHSLVASDYPDFEVIVVDDRSEDGTGDLARAVEPRNAKRIVVLDGTELPEGWMGKPWACAQGAKVATGELLLFTDADTTHKPALLQRAVAGMVEDQADLLTLLGRQLMESFWERLMQPHIFLMMLLRYPDFERIAKRGHWRDALANGQFMFFRLDSYEALGGHEAVHREVVEDQALAQLVKRSGRCLSVRAAEDDFATRMYRSLGDIVEGWSKNIVLGGRASLPPVLRAVMVPGTVLGGIGLWLMPPACLVLAMFGFGGPGLLVWSAAATVISVAIFSRFVWQMHGPPLYGLLYPLGSTMTMYIVLRAAMRGSRVEWKGREYDVETHGDGA